MGGASPPHQLKELKNKGVVDKMKIELMHTPKTKIGTVSDFGDVSFVYEFFNNGVDGESPNEGSLRISYFNKDYIEMVETIPFVYDTYTKVKRLYFDIDSRLYLFKVLIKNKDLYMEVYPGNLSGMTKNGVDLYLDTIVVRTLDRQVKRIRYDNIGFDKARAITLY